MPGLPRDLHDALDDTLARYGPAEMAQAVRRLIGRYRDGSPPTGVVLGSEIDVAAYAGYRMPATFAAVSAALRATALRAPGFAPRTLVDVGGGTGAGVWAATEVWPTLETVTVLEQAEDAIVLGRRLAGEARNAAVRGARWTRTVIRSALSKPPADLVIMSYVLGELPAAARSGVVRSLAADAGLAVLVEPGTPAGYARVLAARDLLVRQGFSVVAPCPHDDTCPISSGQDWCHFAARLPRTALHRQVKSATLSHEDEKFCYLAVSPTPLPKPPARVVRHPLKRKNLVTLRLCTTEHGLTQEHLAKRQGDLYKKARDVSWGDEWPP